MIYVINLREREQRAIILHDESSEHILAIRVRVRDPELARAMISDQRRSKSECTSKRVSKLT